MFTQEPGLDDVIGHQEAKDAILECLELYTKHKEVYKEAGARAPSGVLLYGAPGTGKTLLIKACYNAIIKNDSDFKYKEIKLSDISAGNKTGESEKKIYSLFDSIRTSDKQWILVFDEIDAICPDRLRTKSVCTIERTNALLSCLDGTKGHIDNAFIIGTTNRFSIIDTAIKRSGRFDDAIEIKLPNLKESKQLAKKYLEGLNIKGDKDLIAASLGEYGFGADWAGAEYDNLKTKLVGVYIKNKMTPLTIQQITVTASKIRGAYKTVTPNGI